MKNQLEEKSLYSYDVAISCDPPTKEDLIVPDGLPDCLILLKTLPPEETTS